MNNTDTDCQYHLGVIAGYLTCYHTTLQPVRHPRCAGQRYAEESAQYGTDKECPDSERSDKRGHRLHRRHIFLHKQTYDNEQNTISGISHTHREEQQEERPEYRRRIKLAVNRHTVHSGKDLEHTDKLVVAKLYRRIVLLYGIFLEPVYVHLVELGGKTGIFSRRSKADKRRNHILGALLARRTCKIKVQISAKFVVSRLEFLNR